ncbi:hypothetical protein WAI453_003037 [Rhynchosporium graminicola]|uniref:Related to taurine catabolism dioxygenase n=1 Tax=Rhynchosporium graminicola TaxID=2792576 RepID=A0A1E1LT22_9HELO|nr:related to taurine catabolism dioxygenase [Rhynchosporium commune]
MASTLEWVLPASTPSAVPKPVKASPLTRDANLPDHCFVDAALLTGHKEPLKYSGSLDDFRSFDTTPNIGREFPDANLASWLRAPDSDRLLRDLAITVSRRGVVFFRSQNDMTIELQKELGQRMGLLSGKPATSGLHVFPLRQPGKELEDPEVTVITHFEPDKSLPAAQKVAHQRARLQDPRATLMHRMWHSDTTFEHVTSDYAVLRMVEKPRTGGDTLWASGYELYDRLSPPLHAFFKTLTFTGGQPKYNQAAELTGIPWYEDPRGAPENTGRRLRAVHPVVRTNPVTGWNSIYALGHHVEFINGVSPDESKRLLDWLNDLVSLNHDIQVRYRWENVNDMAIWDNRCVVHTATPDYLGKGLGNRLGYRVASIGERPYLDPEAIGRADAEAKEEQAVLV